MESCISTFHAIDQHCLKIKTPSISILNDKEIISETAVKDGNLQDIVNDNDLVDIPTVSKSLLCSDELNWVQYLEETFDNILIGESVDAIEKDSNLLEGNKEFLTPIITSSIENANAAVSEESVIIKTQTSYINILQDSQEVKLNINFKLFNNLSCLKVLDLRFSCLVYIPPELSSLTSLEYMDLSFNAIVDIPTDIKKLTKITYLNLSNNRIRTIERSLFIDMQRLINLNISFNRLRNLPSSIGYR
jgi:hypothetical protein